MADLDTRLTILDAVTIYDLNRTEEQIDLIAKFAATYRPNLVIIEADAQQKGLGNDERLRTLSQMRHFEIRPHITRGVKTDPIFGVASMDQSFKRGEIRIPYADQETQDRMSPLISQLRAWRPDVQTKKLTQDLVMALWFVWRHWMQIRKRHDGEQKPAWRPSWIDNESAIRGVKLAG